jgi:hypothetical protein
MASDPGFLIDGDTYPVPQAFRLGDPVLVAEVTGLDWMEFAELLDSGDNDPRVMLGLIAVSVWQKNPTWKRERVARWVEGLSMDQVDFEAADDTGDENPTVAADAATTGNSPEVSEPVPEALSV